MAELSIDADQAKKNSLGYIGDSIKINLSTECLTCGYLDVRDDINKIYAGCDSIYVGGEITCAHRPVCKKINSDCLINDIVNQCMEESRKDD